MRDTWRMCGQERTGATASVSGISVSACGAGGIESAMTAMLSDWAYRGARACDGRIAVCKVLELINRTR